MSILILEDKACSQFGGAEKSMLSYIKHLKELGQNIILVYNRDGDWLAESNKKLFVAIYKLDLRHIKIQKLHSFKTVNELRKICKAHQIDKILTHTIHCFPLIRLLKYVVSCKFIVYFKWVLNSDNIGILNSWGIKSIDHVLANSHYVADYWRNFLTSKSVLMVPNGIEVSPTPKINDSCSPIDTLLFIGRIYEGKGLHVLIKALQEFENLELIICGKFDKNVQKSSGSYESEIISIITDLKLTDKVHFQGYVEKPESYMNPNVLVVIPSIWPESASRVLYESMVSKTSVIVSNRGGMVDILGNQADYCSFIPDVNETVLKIAEFLNMDLEKREEICTSLHERFYSGYTMENTHRAIDTYMLEN